MRKSHFSAIMMRGATPYPPLAIFAKTKGVHYAKNSRIGVFGAPR